MRGSSETAATSGCEPPSEFGPPSLFHITVDFVCDDTKELPNLSSLPECLLQLILARILSSGKRGAALQLLRQPNILTSLEIPATTVVDDHWFDAIRHQANSLEELVIADCSGTTTMGLRALSKLTHLKRLHLCQLPCWDVGATEAFMVMPGVRHLHLQGQGVVVVDEFLASRFGCLKGLEHLSLVGANGLSTTEHCVKVAEMCPNLQRVDVSESDIQDEGLCLLLKPLRRLQSITLAGCEALSDKCTEAIAALPKLEMLNLARTGVGDLGVSFLQKLEGLQKLVLCGTRVTDESLRVINSSMKALTELDLSCKRVTDSGLKQLHHLSKLTTLNLSYTQVSDEGMLALRQLPKLANLSLRWTRITDWAIGQLASTEASPTPEPKQEEEAPHSSSVLSLKRIGKSESSESLPLRRSKTMKSSLLERRAGHPRSRELSRGLSRSGDYSQILQRCRATIDFTSRAAPGSVLETPTSTGTPNDFIEDPLVPCEEPLVLPVSLSTTSVEAQAQEGDLGSTPPKPPICKSTAFDDEDCVWMSNSEEDFPQQPQAYRDISQETGSFGNVQDTGMYGEECVYRDMGFDDEEEDVGHNLNLFHSLKFEPEQFRCAEPLDLPEPQSLNFAVEQQPNAMMPPTNTTICAPAPVSQGIFGAPTLNLCSVATRLEDEQDNPVTLQEMRVLDLSVTDVADHGLSFLSAFTHITSLNLFSTKVTDDGLKHVAQLGDLTDLDLCGTEVSDVGLGKLEGLQSLAVLKACGNTRITNDGARRFLEAVEALQSLELRSTSVTEDCLEMIAGVLNCRARHSMH